MASTKAVNTRILWKYTTANALNYAVAAKSVYVSDATDGTKYGGSAPAETVPSLPNKFRMRAVKVTDATAHSIWIPVYTEAAALWTTPGTTVTRNKSGLDVVFTATDQTRGERAERKGKDAAPA